MKDTFGHKLIEEVTVNISIEALWCDMIDGKKDDKVIIWLCYDSPSNNEDKSSMLYSDIYEVVGMKYCIIMGINCETLVTDSH